MSRYDHFSVDNQPLPDQLSVVTTSLEIICMIYIASFCMSYVSIFCVCYVLICSMSYVYSFCMSYV